MQRALLESPLSVAFVGCFLAVSFMAVGNWVLERVSVTLGVTVLTVARILWSGPSYFLRGEVSVP